MRRGQLQIIFSAISGYIFVVSSMVILHFCQLMYSVLFLLLEFIINIFGAKNGQFWAMTHKTLLEVYILSFWDR